MVGGKVSRVIIELLFVQLLVRDGNDKALIKVAKSEASEKVQPGDSIWWQGRKAYWTGGSGNEVALDRVGYSITAKMQAVAS